MSMDFRPTRLITAADLFGGRLEKHGVREIIVEEQHVAEWAPKVGGSVGDLITAALSGGRLVKHGMREAIGAGGPRMGRQTGPDARRSNVESGWHNRAQPMPDGRHELHVGRNIEAWLRRFDQLHDQ
jgi:hypothetical protein